MNDENYIEIKNIVFKREDRIIYNDLSMNIPKGKITVVMGPSGSGKTTLLQLIGKQISADFGTIKVAGKDLTSISRKDLFLLRREIGVLFQSASLFFDLTVAENVAFPLKVHTNLPNSMINDLINMKLQAVGLRGAKSLYPAELSGGMQRRVALARAIVLDPELIMYDEPFVGQDPISVAILLSLIKKISNLQHKTTLIVSHNINEALSIADMIYIVADGKIIAQGTPEVIRNSKSEYVNQFINGLIDGPVAFHFPSHKNYTDELLGNAND